MTAATRHTTGNTGKLLRYHHGNLRAALIEAAGAIIAEKGVEGVSLRALAKATEVSPGAPYSHFRDKTELLAAVAEAGFQRLALSMADAAAGAKTAGERVERLIAGYVGFATENTALFRLMFGRELANMKAFPTLAMTAGKSYALISAALSSRGSREVDTRFLTVTIWSLCHGLATLMADRRLDPAAFGAPDTADFVKKTVAVFGAHLA